jgi:hypothetical protein
MYQCIPTDALAKIRRLAKKARMDTVEFLTMPLPKIEIIAATHGISLSELIAVYEKVLKEAHARLFDQAVRRRSH